MIPAPAPASASETANTALGKILVKRHGSTGRAAGRWPPVGRARLCGSHEHAKAYSNAHRSVVPSNSIQRELAPPGARDDPQPAAWCGRSAGLRRQMRVRTLCLCVVLPYALLNLALRFLSTHDIPDGAPAALQALRLQAIGRNGRKLRPWRSPGNGHGLGSDHGHGHRLCQGPSPWP